MAEDRYRANTTEEETDLMHLNPPLYWAQTKYTKTAV